MTSFSKKLSFKTQYQWRTPKRLSDRNEKLRLKFLRLSKKSLTPKKKQKNRRISLKLSRIRRKITTRIQANLWLNKSLKMWK